MFDKNIKQKIPHANSIVYDEKLIKYVADHTNFATPYLLTDLGNIVEKCRVFKSILPGVELLFAVKAGYSEEIIQATKPYVDGYDVASVGEIKDLISYGVSPDLMNYSNPVKSPRAIRQAYKLGVRKYAFQSLSELAKLQFNAPGSCVYLRVKLSDSASYVPLSDKYGCNYDDAIALLRYAATAGLVPYGFTFHVGSQLLDLEAWPKAIHAANLLSLAARKAGLDAKNINIGGGFAARYLLTDPDLSQAAKLIKPALNKVNTYRAEPGRYLVASASVLASRVIGVEEREKQTWLFLDVSFYQAFLGAMNYETFPYIPVSISHRRDEAEINKETKKYILTGPTCDSQDIICRDIVLPTDMAVGDLLVFPNMGAYTTAYGSEFNGFKLPRRRYVDE